MSTESASESPAHVDRSTDAFFDALADARRRYVLTYLRENGRVATRDELADAVAAWENRREAETAEGTRDDASLSLHHRHLPKLERTGLTERTVEGVSLTERGVSAVELFSPTPSERTNESSA